jgi:hypothetical protein
MVYLARIEPSEGASFATPAATRNPAPKTDFSPLEWSIIRLARGDAVSTIREPGPLRRFYGWLIGRNLSRRLANERLEALRRIAVLSWHFGFSVAGEDVADFLSAGFTPEQYELLVSSVRAPQLRTIAGEVLA